MPTVRINFDGAGGRVAIYTGIADDAPLTDPVGNPARTLFHSSLLYPSIVAVHTGSLSLPARSAAYGPWPIEFYQHTLFAHGRGGRPWIEGKWIGVGTGGVDAPALGTYPIQDSQSMFTTGRSTVNRWLHIGADATNVYAHEMVSVPVTPFAHAALTVSYEITIMDVLLA
jgi:hypothetical protein